MLIIVKFLKKICMHIAATSPLSIDKETLDEKLVNQEREVLLEQVSSCLLYTSDAADE